MNQYIIMAALVAAAVGWGGWQKMIAHNAKLETEAVRASLEMAQDQADRAVRDADHNKAVADGFKSEVSRQREIAAAEAKKSRQRLDAYNALARKIANVPENPPVPDAIELVLDRMRSAAPGTPGTDRAHENGSEGEAADPRSNLPAGTEPAPEAPGS